MLVAAFVQLWRHGSASVHGHYWADEMRENPAMFDHEWFQTAIQGAWLFLQRAIELYALRSAPPDTGHT